MRRYVLAALMALPLLANMPCGGPAGASFLSSDEQTLALVKQCLEQGGQVACVKP